MNANINNTIDTNNIATNAARASATAVGTATAEQWGTAEHLAHVEIGDIVLLTSPFEGPEQPWLSPETCEWLVGDRKIKMLGIGPGVLWRYQEKLPAPKNSPVKRILLGANVPIVHPLVNIDSLTKARVFYISMPLRMTKMEASFTRAIALEDV